MRRARMMVAVVLALLMAGGAGMIWRRHLQAPDLTNLSREEPPFGTMRMPPGHVLAWYAADASSIAVIVRDADGVDFKFAFPHDPSGRGTFYPRAYHGASYEGRPGAVPLKDPARAKEICIALLAEYGDPGHFMVHKLSENEPSHLMENFRQFLHIFR